MQGNADFDPTAEFAVSGIQDITWTTLPFDTLVIPSKTKDMLQALVHNQTPDPDKPAFDDFIEGKGKGLIVLLQYVFSFAFAVAHCLLLQWSTGSGKDVDGRGGLRISETTALSSLSTHESNKKRRSSLTPNRYVPEISVSIPKSSKTASRRSSTSSLAGRPSYSSTKQTSSSKPVPNTTCSTTLSYPSSCGNWSIFKA